MSISVYIYELSTKLKRFPSDSLLLGLIAKVYSLALCLMHILYVKMSKKYNQSSLSCSGKFTLT